MLPGPLHFTGTVLCLKMVIRNPRPVWRTLMPRQPRRTLTLLALLSFSWILPAQAADSPVAQGPSHEPAPYRFNPAATLKAPKTFLEDGPACYLYTGSWFLIDADGTEENIVHEIIRLNNRRGVEQF